MPIHQFNIRTECNLEAIFVARNDNHFKVLVTFNKKTLKKHTQESNTNENKAITAVGRNCATSYIKVNEE